MRPVREREVKIAKAGESGVPIMKGDRMVVMPRVKIMAYVSTFYSGVALANNLAYGTPPSRAKELCTYQ